ncbi:hypothetical protein C0Q44_11340 [Paenibacillus sp. PCH8]|uniref:tetratricopeptide repeat protein n=1 Tax=Paenibacillus sp. PCH8 TaxID=2066524 RepID=UPI000CF8E6EE|nr:tetratricopeptide repeat protein [Paenibacillus sp. PCH8]PQP85055.1 hypothetical protein C0Q44_11340 [Paenibacillus sp. PCH8]
MDSNIINILHLSDMHFGMDKDSTQVAQRKNALDELLKTIAQLSNNDKPHIIVVSGDLTWQGKKEGFLLAKDWLEKLLHLVDLSPNDLILCAGNHDINRKKTIGLGIPNSSSEADTWLSIENMDNFYGPFSDYIEFYTKINCPPLEINQKENFLVGSRELKGIKFIVLNSSWFCRDNADARKLWIGLPHLEMMNSEENITRDVSSRKLTISVLHHPVSWLNEEEQVTYENRPATYRYLSERTDLILSGHTHGAVESATRSFNKAYFVSGGAAYSGGRFRNNFSLLKIDLNIRVSERIPYEFDPRNGNWNRIESEKLFLNDVIERGEDLTSKKKGESKIWNVPHRQHPFFVGRKYEIEEIRKTFDQQPKNKKLISIYGMGGIGKSQLAVEYSYLFEDMYQAVWWVRSDETVTMIADIEEFCLRLELPIRDGEDQSIAKEELFIWMEKNENWLLIFDNVENSEDLDNFIPLRYRGDILITSRNPNWVSGMKLNLLKSEDSIEFLTKSTGINDIRGARELSEELADLPLALEQASAYIRESGLTLSEYLERFKTYRNQIASKGSPLNYSSTIVTTWEVSIQKVSEEFPVASNFMKFCSFLFPELISKKIITSSIAMPEFLKNKIVSQLYFDDLLSKLRSYSLIQTEQNGFTIHRLTQLVIIEKMDTQEKNEWISIVATFLLNLYNNSEYLEIQISEMVPHILQLSSYSENNEHITEDFINLLNVSYLYYLDFGVLSEAKKVAESINEYSKNIISNEKKSLLIKSYLNLSEVYAKLGQFNEAKKHVLMADHIVENVDEKAKILNNLIHIEREIGNFNGSLSAYFKLDELIEENPSQFDDFDLVKIAVGLGMTLSNMSDYEKAEECYKKAINYWVKYIKTPDKFLALVYSNLGNIYRLKGENDNARNYFKRALEINEKIFGLNHSSISSDYGNIGLTYYTEHDYFYARRYFRKAIEINKIIFDESNAHNAILLNNLGMVEEAEYNFDKAEKYYMSSLEIFKHLGNDENHDFANCYYNLGGLYQLKSDFHLASHYLNKALELDEKIYGSDHPEVAKDLGKIGTMLIDRYKLDAGINHLKKAKKIYEVKRLERSPDYVLCLANLALAFYMKGNKKNAKKMLEDSLSLSSNIMGKNNGQQAFILRIFQATLIKMNEILNEVPFLNYLLSKYELYNSNLLIDYFD